MNRRRSGRAGPASLLLLLFVVVAPAQADEAEGRPTVAEMRAGRRAAATPASGGWAGPAGIAAALALLGGASLVARRQRPGGALAGPGPLRVVGRTSLSPRHAVYLLQAGDRVLIVGTGPQGPPALLGEVAPEPPAAGGGG